MHCDANEVYVGTATADNKETLQRKGNARKENYKKDRETFLCCFKGILFY